MNTELKNNLKSFLDRLIKASQDGTIHPELFEADADTLRAAIKLEAENARLREELAAARERIKDLVAGDVMHEPDWRSSNEV